jgi:hypothetical protein
MASVWALLAQLFYARRYRRMRLRQRRNQDRVPVVQWLRAGGKVGGNAKLPR